MRKLLPPCALVIADAGYTGYAFWQALHDAGHALELRWAVLGRALLGLWAAQSQRAADRDPRPMSLALALRHLRAVLRDPARRGRRCDTLSMRLAGAVRDTYARRAPKSSGHWPHKNNDGPPGAPKITPAHVGQILAAKALIPQSQAA